MFSKYRTGSGHPVGLRFFTSNFESRLCAAVRRDERARLFRDIRLLLGLARTQG